MVPLILAMAGCASTRMKLVDSGSFQMGEQQMGKQPGETPVHTVFVSAFYMDRFEVTKLFWDKVRNWGLTNGYVDLPSCAGGWVGVRGHDACTSNTKLVICAI